mmetsp:Transcript_17086/g.40769  ORF Transcript_17086/g.40769 Transcript_17086/m.40769 type:complete len:86 (-) Transcript_17086:497-754(-)
MDESPETGGVSSRTNSCTGGSSAFLPTEKQRLAARKGCATVWMGFDVNTRQARGGDAEQEEAKASFAVNAIPAVHNFIHSKKHEV